MACCMMSNQISSGVADDHMALCILAVGGTQDLSHVHMYTSIITMKYKMNKYMTTNQGLNEQACICLYKGRALVFGGDCLFRMKLGEHKRSMQLNISFHFTAARSHIHSLLLSPLTFVSFSLFFTYSHVCI